MLQFFTKIIGILCLCGTILAGVYILVYYSPYQTFMRDCIKNEMGDFGVEYCTWKYDKVMLCRKESVCFTYGILPPL
jgi:hypothetical protein